jgi:hypothetical protein
MVTRASGARFEWLLAPSAPPEEVEDARHCRSTLIIGSQSALRERGLFDAYAQLVSAPFKDAILSAVPGQWLPLEAARAHYTACDALKLTDDVLVQIGALATRRASGTAITFARRVAQGAGVSPLTILAQSQRFWDNMWDGGNISVARTGPKDARVHVVGYPLANLHYNRVTMRGILVAAAELFCGKVYVKEVPALCNDRCLGMHVSWV